MPNHSFNITANGYISASFNIGPLLCELSASAECGYFDAIARWNGKPILTFWPADMDYYGGFYRFFYLAFSWSPSAITIDWGKTPLLRLDRSPLSFSERNGYRKYWQLPMGWRVQSVGNMTRQQLNERDRASR